MEILLKYQRIQTHNKRLKRDCQRVAFPVPLSRGGFGCCDCLFLWHFVQVLSAIQYCLSLPNEAAMCLAL